MKVQLIRDANGTVFATVNEAEEGSVPLEADTEPGQEIEVLEVARRDLFDLDNFYKQCADRGKH